VARLFEHLDCELVPLYIELDGTFPNHEANPLKEENLVDLKAAVLEKKADLGVAYDGDADRSAFVDEKGQTVPCDLMTALLARQMLQGNPGRAVLYDLRSSWVVAEEIERAGGRPVRERVGHSFMKATLRREDAIFGGELSGHYYFAENFFADSADIAVVQLLNLMRSSGRKLSALIEPLKRYSATGEINFVVEDADLAMKKIEETFADGKIDHLDGITVQYPDWWFNVRKSNTEPLVRLNLEARDPRRLATARERLMALLGQPEE
jgi:phosphomannomutase